MLLNYPCCTKISRGDVFEWKRPGYQVFTDKGIIDACGYRDCRWVVVSNDDVIYVRPCVLVCPITRSKGNKELEGQDAIGKIQYVFNGVIYTIHCEEVQPVDKRAFGDRIFHLSSSIVDNIVVGINQMLSPGAALELDPQEISEEYANRTDNPVPFRRDTELSRKLNQILSGPGNIEVSNEEKETPNEERQEEKEEEQKVEEEPVVEVKEEEQVQELEVEEEPTPEPEVTITTTAIDNEPLAIKVKKKGKKGGRKPLSIPITDQEFLKKWEAQPDQRGQMYICKRYGITLKQGKYIYQRAKNAKWENNEDMKIEFVLDYERYKNNEVDFGYIADKYQISANGAAVKYAAYMKS